MASYVELIVRGDDRDAKAYLTGHIAASSPVRVVFADEAGFRIHELRERIKHHGEVQHVFVEQAQASRIRDALAAAAPRYRFDVKEERAVSGVHFAFDFDTPSPEVAARIKHVLANPPAGVTLEDYTPRERRNATASGAELYAPEHGYDFAGRGVIRGDLFAVVDARALLSAIDFVDCAEIEVERA
jgi:hypothetical protein